MKYICVNPLLKFTTWLYSIITKYVAFTSTSMLIITCLDCIYVLCHCANYFIQMYSTCETNNYTMTNG